MDGWMGRSGVTGGGIRVRLGIRLGAALLALAAGCTDDGRGRAERGVAVADSAGVEVVESSESGWNETEAWHLEPVLRVGDVDGPLTFGQVRWVAPGRAGQVIVLDGQSHLIHVFGPNGRRLRAFGGKGGGPGEFRSPASVTSLGDGRVAVAEGFPPALHWLDSAGTYLRTFRPPVTRSTEGTGMAAALSAWQVTRSGIAFAQSMVFGPPAGEASEMPVWLVRYGRDAAAAPDTVATWTWSPGFGEDPVRVFEPTVTWSPLDDGSVLVAPGSPYEIRRYGPGGDLDRVIRRKVEPAAVTEWNRKAALGEMRTSMAEAGAPEGEIDRMLGDVSFRSHVPDVLRVWASEPDGRIWVGVYDETVARRRRGNGLIRVNAWDVFTDAGRYEGRLEAPAGFELHVATEDALYGVWKDELEVPFAQVYRIARPGEAGADAARH